MLPGLGLGAHRVKAAPFAKLRIGNTPRDILARCSGILNFTGDVQTRDAKMKCRTIRQFLLPGVLFVAATTGLAPAAQALDVFTYFCEIRRPTTGWEAWTASGEEYDVTYHIDLTSMTYTTSQSEDPDQRYQIESVEDDGSISLTRRVTIHPEKGTYRYFLQDHNFQVSYYGTCTVTE